jgi:hypothetical protein
MKNNREAEKPDRRTWEPREPNDAPLAPGSHPQLWQIAIKLPTDYEPDGQMKRESFVDCSCGCRWCQKLAGLVGQDWGVYANAASPRAGFRDRILAGHWMVLMTWVSDTAGIALDSTPVRGRFLSARVWCATV